MSPLSCVVMISSRDTQQQHAVFYAKTNHHEKYYIFFFPHQLFSLSLLLSPHHLIPITNTHIQTPRLVVNDAARMCPRRDIRLKPSARSGTPLRIYGIVGDCDVRFNLSVVSDIFLSVRNQLATPYLTVLMITTS
ncbi:uncharacterized protein DFL_007349 [Arthrobotrys flagrans]|nr:hypothetical protein DFL_007349 [Arthrobotrys flagrans]